MPLNQWGDSCVNLLKSVEQLLHSRLWIPGQLGQVTSSHVPRWLASISLTPISFYSGGFRDQ